MRESGFILMSSEGIVLRVYQSNDELQTVPTVARVRIQPVVGWVEPFGYAQDKLRDTHRLLVNAKTVAQMRWVSAQGTSTHPTG
jgi:hypothetical protein